MDYGIFYGNILNFIQKNLYLKIKAVTTEALELALPTRVGYSLKNQGSYNSLANEIGISYVGYPLKNQGSYNSLANEIGISYVGYPLKNQGSYYTLLRRYQANHVGYPLKNQGCYNGFMFGFVSHWLDIHLKIKTVTTPRGSILAG